MSADVFVNGLPTEDNPEVIDIGGCIFKIYSNRVIIIRSGKVFDLYGASGEIQILFEDVSQVLFKEPVSLLMRGFIAKKESFNGFGRINFVVPGRIGGNTILGLAFDRDAVYWPTKADTERMRKVYDYICERVSLFSKEKSEAGQGKGDDISEKLMNLAKLRNDGLISDEEFSAAKAKLLGL